MSYNKLNENPPPSYQATISPQEPPPKYEAAYPPQGTYPAQQSTVITNQPIIVIQNGFGPYSKVLTCPNCRASVSTSLDYEPGVLTWISSGLICLFGCWFGCCLIPFCLSDCQDVKHKCPNCGHFVGMYRRIN